MELRQARMIANLVTRIRDLEMQLNDLEDLWKDNDMWQIYTPSDQEDLVAVIEKKLDKVKKELEIL